MPTGLIQAAEAGGTVLVPSTELAAALFDAVERAHRDAGHEVWPTPRIRDFGSWQKEQHVRGQLTDSTTPRCLTDIEEREFWRSVVLESDAGAQYMEPSGAARAARRARRAMHEYGIPWAALAQYDSEETRTFLEWNARFDRRCREHHCISADQLTAVLDADAQSSVSGIAWIDSPAWRPVARRWLERQAGAWLPAPDSTPADARVARLPSAAAELAAIAAWAHDHRQMRPDFRAWICVPDLASRRDDVIDAMDAALAPQRFSVNSAAREAPYAVAGGTPLADFAPVRAALDFLSASTAAVSFDAFSAVLRAAQPHASVEEAGAAARLDLALRRRAPSEASLEAWLALAARVARSESLDMVPALRRLEQAHRTLAAASGEHPMSYWPAVWVAAFEAGPWELRQNWSSTEYQAAERFRELLATLATGDAIFGRQSRTAAEGILRRAARDTPYQTQTGIPPVWVSGQLQDPWLRYDGIWVASCAAERWPPPADPIPLLPVRLQRDYGVVAAALASQLEFAEDLQRRWLGRAPQCVFSYADDADSHTASPSPLLACEGVLAVGETVTVPHWAAQQRVAPPLEQLADEWAPAFGADERVRGVSTLRAQSSCPFRGFAETRLRAEALERPLPGFNERERGELLHDALHRIWSVLRSSAGLFRIAADSALSAGGALAAEGALADLLRDSAHKAIAKLCERRNPGKRWQEREQTRLENLLVRWLEIERGRAAFTVEQLESERDVARYAGLEFNVRIDRMDRLADGSRVIIDYKSGWANPDWRGERPDNLQLPVYALLHPTGLVAVAYGQINAAECRFVAESERGGILLNKRPSKMEGQPSFAALLELWRLRIERIAGDFAAGYAAVDPTPSACRRCTLQGLCRVPSTLDIEGSRP